MESVKLSKKDKEVIKEVFNYFKNELGNNYDDKVWVEHLNDYFTFMNDKLIKIGYKRGISTKTFNSIFREWKKENIGG